MEYRPAYQAGSKRGAILRYKAARLIRKAGAGIKPGPLRKGQAGSLIGG